MNQLSGRYLEDFAVGQTFDSGRLRIDTTRRPVMTAKHMDAINPEPT